MGLLPDDEVFQIFAWLFKKPFTVLWKTYQNGFYKTPNLQTSGFLPIILKNYTASKKTMSLTSRPSLHTINL